jgi:uncharacterized protein
MSSFNLYRFRRAACLIVVLPMIASASNFIVPELSAPIVDKAGFIPVSARSRLENALHRIHDVEGLQIAALIVPDLSGLTIEEAAIRVADAWKLGSKKEDKGALLLIAVAEKKIRIEVGQGLEGDIPDALAKRIIAERMAPLIGAGDAEGAVTVGLYSIAQAAFPDKNMRPYFEESSFPSPSRSRESRPLTTGELIVLGILLFLALFTRTGRNILLLALMSGGRGGYRGGSGGSGSRSYRGGGGGFSGGGASGGW